MISPIMKKTVVLFKLVAFFLLTACVSVKYDSKQQKPAPDMTPQEAREVLRNYIRVENKRYFWVTGIKDLKFKKDGFSFISIYKQDDVEKSHTCSILYTDNKITEVIKAPALDDLIVLREREPICGFLLKIEDAKKFTDAIRVLQDEAAGKANPKAARFESEFEAKAKAWKEMKTKPLISEEVRRFKIQAEGAFQQKRFEDAVSLYEKGLALEPMWANGYYNSALILAEIGRYDAAVDKMKRFILLSSDPSEIRSAKDKIYLWEELALK